MKMTFLEKYGIWISCIFLMIFAWYGLTAGLQVAEGFEFLFPINWLQVFPFTEPISAAFNVHIGDPWWLWTDIFVTAVTWMCIFFIMRGIYIHARNMEGGISMWLAFVLLTLVVMLFLMLVLWPVLAQMAIWWEDWPDLEDM